MKKWIERLTGQLNKWFGVQDAGKERTVHSGSCLGELRFLVFLVLGFYFAMQLLQRPGEHAGLANAVNMLLFMLFSGGTFFCSGYAFGDTAAEAGMMFTSGGDGSSSYGSGSFAQDNGKASRARLLRNAGVCFAAYALLCILYNYGVNHLALSACIYRMLLFKSIPPVAGPALTLGALSLAVWVFCDRLRTLAVRPLTGLAMALICLAVSLLRQRSAGYMPLLVLTGGAESTIMPGVPYFAFFLAGMHMARHRRGIRLSWLAVSVGVTALSFVFYRSPLQDLLRVTASLGLVYVLYGGALLLTDLSARQHMAQRVFALSPAAFVMNVLLLFALRFASLTIVHPLLVLLASVCMTVLSYGILLLGRPALGLYEQAADRLQGQLKHRRLAYFLGYTGFFAVLLLIAFFSFLRNGRTLIHNGDGVSQYYPRAVYFADYIRTFLSSLLHGKPELPMYDFRIGMGAEVTYIMEPLYYLYALFGGSNAEFTYSLLTLLRFYLSGLAAFAMILHFGKGYFAALAGSIAYVFCGFAFDGGLMHPMFMVPMILLPLQVMAVEEILQGRRWYLMPVLVAVSLFSNYYFFYMSTLGLGVYFLVRFFCQDAKEKRTLRKFLLRLGTLAGTYLLGAGLACVVLVTNVGMYFGSGRGSSMNIKTPSLLYYTSEWAERIFLTFVTVANSPGEWLKLGFLPLTVFAVVLLFTRRKKKELRLLFLLGIVFMLFPVFGLVFSAFSAVLNRWCYLFALVVAFILADTISGLWDMTRKELYIGAGVILCYACLYFFGEALSTRYVRLGLAMLILTWIVLFVCQWKKVSLTVRVRQFAVLLLIVVQVAVQSLSFYQVSGEVSRYMKPGRTREVVTDTPLAAISELEDDSFYRSAVARLDYTTISSALMLDYNGITNFWSTLNGNITEYLEKLGSTSYTQTQMMGLNNSLLMNTLASVKYYGEYSDSKVRPLPYGCIPVMKSTVQDQPVQISENLFALPLGYTYDGTISPEQLETYDLLERQEVMMQKAVVAGMEGDTDDIATGSRRLKVTKTKEKGAHLTDQSLYADSSESSSRSIRLTFEGVPNSETYLVLKKAQMPGTMDEERVYITVKTKDNTVQYRFNSSTFRYRTGQEDYVINLGYHEEALNSCTIRLEKDCAISFDSWGIYALPMDSVDAWSTQRRADVLENVSVQTNRVSGTISLEEDKMLVLSIPYQRGWTAYVDGESVPVSRVNYMYMGLPLSAGDHRIELNFAFPGIGYCPAVFLITLLVYVTLVLLDYFYRLKKEKEGEEKTEEPEA